MYVHVMLFDQLWFLKVLLLGNGDLPHPNNYYYRTILLNDNVSVYQCYSLHVRSMSFCSQKSANRWYEHANIPLSKKKGKLGIKIQEWGERWVGRHLCIPQHWFPMGRVNDTWLLPPPPSNCAVFYKFHAKHFAVFYTFQEQQSFL